MGSTGEMEEELLQSKQSLCNDRRSDDVTLHTCSALEMVMPTVGWLVRAVQNGKTGQPNPSVALIVCSANLTSVLRSKR